MPVADRQLYPDFVILINGDDVTSDYISVAWDDNADMIDVSAGTSTRKAYRAGRADDSITLEFSDVVSAASGGTTVLRNALRSRAEGTLEFAPEGTASGNPKYEIKFIVESVSNNFKSYTDAPMRTAQLRSRDGEWLNNFDLNSDTY